MLPFLFLVDTCLDADSLAIFALASLAVTSGPGGRTEAWKTSWTRGSKVFVERVVL
jgi:hypothetical protein